MHQPSSQSDPQHYLDIQHDPALTECIEKSMGLSLFEYSLLSPGKYVLFSVIMFAFPFLWDVGMTVYSGLTPTTLYFDGCNGTSSSLDNSLLTMTDVMYLGAPPLPPSGSGQGQGPPPPPPPQGPTQGPRPQTSTPQTQGPQGPPSQGPTQGPPLTQGPRPPQTSTPQTQGPQGPSPRPPSPTSPPYNVFIPYLQCVKCNNGTNQVAGRTDIVSSFSGIIIYLVIALYVAIHRYTLRCFQNIICCKLLGYGIYVRPNARGVWINFVPTVVIVLVSAVWNLGIVLSIRKARTEKIMLTCGTYMATFQKSNPALEFSNGGLDMLTNIVPYIPLAFGLYDLLKNPFQPLSIDTLYGEGIEDDSTPNAGNKSIASGISSSLRYQVDIKNFPWLPDDEHWDDNCCLKWVSSLSPVIPWKWAMMRRSDDATMKFAKAMTRFVTTYEIEYHRDDIMYEMVTAEIGVARNRSSSTEYIGSQAINTYVKKSMMVRCCGQPACKPRISRILNVMYFIVPFLYQMLSVVPTSGSKVPHAFYDSCVDAKGNQASSYDVCLTCNQNSPYVDVPAESMNTLTVISMILNTVAAIAISIIYAIFTLQGRQAEHLLAYGIYVHYEHTKMRKILLGVVAFVLLGLAVLQCLIALNVNGQTRSSKPRLGVRGACSNPLDPGPYYATFNSDNPVNNVVLDLSSVGDYARFVYSVVTSYLAVVIPLAAVVGETYGELTFPSLYGTKDCCADDERTKATCIGPTLERHLKHEISHGNFHKCVDAYLKRTAPQMSFVERIWRNVTFMMSWGDHNALVNVLSQSKIAPYGFMKRRTLAMGSWRVPPPVPQILQPPSGRVAPPRSPREDKTAPLLMSL